MNIFKCVSVALVVISGFSARAGTVSPNYIYAEKPMNEVNYLYIGYAPRANRAEDVEVTFSKAGFTLHAALKMTDKDVASYPDYLRALPSRMRFPRLR